MAGITPQLSTVVEQHGHRTILRLAGELDIVCSNSPDSTTCSREATRADTPTGSRQNLLGTRRTGRAVARPVSRLLPTGQAPS